ncbi:MAG: hypothetical protein PVJ55_12465, partial [Anaerolineae bacterium]
STTVQQERSTIDPPPRSAGRAIEKLKEAQASGVGWQTLYEADVDVRAFVDHLVDVIVRGEEHESRDISGSWQP